MEPSASPSRSDPATTLPPTSMEMRAPWITREKMSRPSSSVPNQCAALGGCRREGRLMLLGFCGAIQGANSAKITNSATSATPAVASALRRPSAAAVLQVVERAIVVFLFRAGLPENNFLPLMNTDEHVIKTNASRIVL